MNISWTKSEICKLFSMVAECRSNHQPIMQAFTIFAKRFYRKPLTVRNFYYNKLKEFESSPLLCKEFDINLNFHKKIEQCAFSKQEYENELSQVAKLVDGGMSIRKACGEVAKDNLKLMLRLQNKFYSLKKFENENMKKMVNKIKINNKENNIILEKNNNFKNIKEKITKNIKKPLKKEYFNNYLKNKYSFENNKQFENKINIKEFNKNVGGEIVYMPKKKTGLSDDEINSLFMGLVKLVKKSAAEKAETFGREEIKIANENLRQVVIALAEKERECDELRKKIEFVQSEKNKLTEKLQNELCNKCLTHE